MNELRKDYFLERYAIIAKDRAKRPDQFDSSAKQKDAEVCYFCPGNEHLTPKEIGRLEDGNGWYARWFENKFPVVKFEGKPLLIEDDGKISGSAFGRHEVIVESPKHSDELSHLSEHHIKQLLEVFNSRINELEAIEGIKYVQVFKNHLKEAGTSIVHTHSQIVATSIIPVEIEIKLASLSKHSKCAYCGIAESESKSERVAFLGRNFVAFCPFASRFSNEIWIMPKKHVKRMSEFTEEELLDLASIIKLILVKLKSINAPYNLAIFYSPSAYDLHFHIEIMPRLSIFAGFELSSGIIINPVSPEDAAKFYKQ